MPTGKPPVYPQPGNQGPVPAGVAAGGALFTIGSNAFLNAGAVAQGGTVTAVSQTAVTLLGNPGTAAAHATTIPLGAGLFFSGGAIVANYQAGTLTSFGTGLSLVAGVLNATAADQWHAGPVSFLSGGLSINSGTLTVQYSAGVLTSIGTGLNLTTGVLTAQWSAGAVSSVAGGLSVVGGVLQDQWSAGSVTSLGAGLTLTAGVLHT